MQPSINLKTVLLSNKALIFLCVFCLCYCFVMNIFVKPKLKYSENTTSITGKIISYKFTDELLTLEVKGKEKIIIKYYIHSTKDISKYKKMIKYGQEILVRGSISDISSSIIPGTFNYQKYAKHKHIYHIMKASNVEILKKENLLYKMKNFLLDIASQKENKDYILALCLGIKDGLDYSTKSTFQQNGISHLLAVSGLHIGIIIFLINIFTKKSIYRISILFLFLFLTNFSSSCLRAVLFFTLSEINHKYNLGYKSIYLLIITALIILFISPSMIYDIGFLYSFTASFGILYYQDKLTHGYFQNLLLISLVSFLFTLPITCLLNYEINLASIFNNLIFVPLVSSIIFPLCLLSFIPFVPSIFLSLSIKFFQTLNALALKWAIMISVPRLPVIFITIMYISLIFIKYKPKLLFVFPFLLLCNSYLPKLDNLAHVYFLDVGQGDLSLITYPHNQKSVMIDTSGKISFKEKSNNFNTYEIQNIIKFLKSKGIKKIDYLILTHGDYDHMGEAINLVNNFKIKKVIFNCGEFNDLEKELIKVLDKKKIKYYSCIKKLNIDNNKLYFLQTKEYENENDNSNVIYTKLNGYKFMFMGDAGVEKEKDILDKYNISDIDVLKVGHHGSKTSSDKQFIDEIKPKYSIISVGKNNRYGHPNKEVLDTLNDSKIYRTDQDGSIMFKIKKDKLQIETCSP